MNPHTFAIKLVRHGESLANVNAVNPQETGDFKTSLTPRGEEQARHAGRSIGATFLEGALVYASPYVRARQTLGQILDVTGSRETVSGVYEDPRLREVDHGYSDLKAQEVMRETHGWFYYRFQGGESPADCFDRVSGFLETLMRQVGRRNADRVLIVTHGLALRCFVMRFLHLTVEEFERMENPENGDVVTISPCAPATSPSAPAHERAGWRETGIRWRKHENP